MMIEYLDMSQIMKSLLMSNLMCLHRYVSKDGQKFGRY